MAEAAVAAEVDQPLDARRDVAAEVALTIVLLAGAGLMIRSMYELLHVPAGFEAEGVLTLQLNVEACPATLMADPTQFRQIIDNLLSNAVKFTPQHGQVMVIARRIEDMFVEIVVTDTGIGIARENLSMIFELFRQADSSETRLYGGAGLGLYIAKNFTELLRGKIEVETEEGKGSVFIVTIPSYTRSNDRPSAITARGDDSSLS